MDSIEIKEDGIFIFHRFVQGLGEIKLRRVSIQQDIPFIHNWVSQEYALFWGMQHKTLEQVREEYAKIISTPHTEVYLGFVGEHPCFLIERYKPEKDILAQYYQASKTDCGMHLLVAPASKPISGFTQHIFESVLHFLFSQTLVERIVIEPDIRNEKMIKLCQKVGFYADKAITLPHKTALLAFLTRNDFFKNIRNTMNTLTHLPSPAAAINHISPSLWEKANLHLVRKTISEFAHEHLLEPDLMDSTGGWGVYVLQADDEEIKYTFKAKILQLNHWWIEPASIEKYIKGEKTRLDALLFIKEFNGKLNIPSSTLPIYLEEITSTLSSSVFKLSKGNPLSEDLSEADFQTIEHAMTEGHPGFVANNGRIGFDTQDYHAFAPEKGNPFPLVWLAGKKDRTVYAGTKALPYNTLISNELDAETLSYFHKVIADKGFEPNNYLLIPVHPWQWFNKLANIFSTEIAAGNLICVGYGPDLYQAQQSIRTLFNLSNPHKFYTKTSLSILNMGFMRGLPVYYLGSAPEMAEWLGNLLGKDEFLKETGFKMLGEIASISYINPYYADFGKHHDYNKMLASLWRESPYTYLQKGQKAMTMAALLHIDQEGKALLPALIKASSLRTEAWLSHYLKAYLSPLIHCFYQYDLVFMPHGENIILAMENNVPVGIFLKDITEEAAILNPAISLPKNIERMFTEVPEDIKLLSIFIDIFDGFFRFLSQVLIEHCDLEETKFWELVANCIHYYQEQHPQLEAKFQQYDLFAPSFQLSCLNRLQLNNNKTMINLDDPVALLQFRGKLQNPIASFRQAILAKNSIL